MRNLLALFGFALIVFLIAGYYLDWYSLTTSSSNADHIGISVDVNKKKIGDDVKQGVESGSRKVHEIIDGKSSEPKKK